MPDAPSPAPIIPSDGVLTDPESIAIIYAMSRINGHNAISNNLVSLVAVLVVLVVSSYGGI